MASTNYMSFKRRESLIKEQEAYDRRFKNVKVIESEEEEFTFNMDEEILSFANKIR